MRLLARLKRNLYLKGRLPEVSTPRMEIRYQVLPSAGDLRSLVAPHKSRDCRTERMSIAASMRQSGLGYGIVGIRPQYGSIHMPDHLRYLLTSMRRRLLASCVQD